MSDDVPSIALKGLADLISSSGQSPSDLARRVGIDPAALERSDLMVSEIAINDLFEEAAKCCNDRFLSLKLAKIKGVETLGKVWLLMQEAETVGDLLRVIAANLESHSRGLSVYVIRADEGVSINLEVRDLSRAAHKKVPLNEGTTQMIEHCLAIICNTLREIISPKWNPKYVQFRHAKPDDCISLRQVFGERLFFNQDVNAIHLETGDCLRPYTMTKSSINTPMSDWFKSTNMPFALRVDRIIRQMMNASGGTSELVAEALSMPVRTMQYHLKKEQTSFQKIYNEIRLEFAKYYLNHSTLPVSAVAERLHFSTLAAFSKFFKAQVGYSPIQHIEKKSSASSKLLSE